jgi:hypothetical protein
MAEQEANPDLLQGKQVAFSGRLASMTRAEAAGLVRCYGGTCVSSVNRRTSFLIVGADSRQPANDGGLTQNRQRAQALQRAGYSITILPEQEWLTHLGLEPGGDGIHRLYSAGQVIQLLKIPGSRLRSWIRAGLIHACESVHGISYFDYTQVAGARTLCELTRAGVKPERIRQSLQQLAKWLGDVEEPLAQLAALEKGGELLVRLEDGLVEPSGQGRLDFSAPEPCPIVAVPQGPQTADEWFAFGCQEEKSGRLEEAIQAYRQALLSGGADIDICFKLANALYACGDKAEASERFYQVVEMEPRFAQAWNNLATCMVDLGRQEEALTGYRRALEVDPGYADAHYNLADLLEEIGCKAEAQTHWQAYVQRDPHSEWGRHAKAQLSAWECVT